MVRGLESFKNWFKEYDKQYTIIGGTACSLLMEYEGVDFRATKDIDIVLMVEALTYEFGTHFWEYAEQAGYQRRNKSEGSPQFYRFSNPKSKEFPGMIELFSRETEKIPMPKDALITPIPFDYDVSSLSAILLDEDYYKLLQLGRTVLEGLPILSAEYIIPFKAKAWLDLNSRKAIGEHIDSRDIKKHKNDVFRLYQLLEPETKVILPQKIMDDLYKFLNKMAEEPVDLKALNISNKSKENILEIIKNLYNM